VKLLDMKENNVFNNKNLYLRVPIDSNSTYGPLKKMKLRCMHIYKSLMAIDKLFFYLHATIVLLAKTNTIVFGEKILLQKNY